MCVRSDSKKNECAASHIWHHMTIVSCCHYRWRLIGDHQHPSKVHQTYPWVPWPTPRRSGWLWCSTHSSGTCWWCCLWGILAQISTEFYHKYLEKLKFGQGFWLFQKIRIRIFKAAKSSYLPTYLPLLLLFMRPGIFYRKGDGSSPKSGERTWVWMCVGGQDNIKPYWLKTKLWLVEV